MPTYLLILSTSRSTLPTTWETPVHRAAVHRLLSRYTKRPIPLLMRR